MGIMVENALKKMIVFGRLLMQLLLKEQKDI
jgi:hypothetical protein